MGFIVSEDDVVVEISGSGVGLKANSVSLERFCPYLMGFTIFAPICSTEQTITRVHFSVIRLQDNFFWEFGTQCSKSNWKSIHKSRFTSSGK
jgi:hypothetical protein